MKILSRIKSFFTQTLIGGITVLLPIGVLIFIFKFIFDFILGFISPISNIFKLSFEINNSLANLIAFSIIIALCFITGFFIATRLGNFIFYHIENKILKKLPGYKIVTETINQFKGNFKDSFSTVALAEVYGNSLSTAFVIEKTDDYYTLFVPTAPNPTSGNIFHVHKSKVTIVDVKVDEAMRSILAVGSGSKKLIENYKNKKIENN
ncbi:putative membrane protein [Hypnocyclicus thermotrophus]|uniref:Membrane protein n=1 Tax=Hypnocyclicus thermotrophus TaxID=1627895 RepID=A0AA46DZE6_9FUSO|nr:DUF502 domain-containing protein [Hypnocyclicus thermotrophus]TDT71569.1 putative membrane protein [Hypnocyclicus thermotrophus]